MGNPVPYPSKAQVLSCYAVTFQVKPTSFHLVVLYIRFLCFSRLTCELFAEQFATSLLAITHDIFLSFDSSPFLETRGVFSDVSKAFDRVWHDGLLFRLKQNGVSGNLLGLIKSFLSDRVTLNGITSDWACTRADVLQGSILGSHFFLIYINDLANDLKSNLKSFADDTSLFSIVSGQLETAYILNKDLDKIRGWALSSGTSQPNKKSSVFSKKPLGNLFILISTLTYLWLKKCQPKSI